MAYRTIRSILFRLDAETAHDWTQGALRLATSVPGLLPFLFRGARLGSAVRSLLSQRCFDLEFPAPVGLAAGFDKDGGLAAAMARLGFGFVEVGTVTPKAQRGNPKPRLFRYPATRSLQNAMGFNNAGMESMARRLTAYRSRAERVPVGVNVGKNKSTPLDEAHEDYRLLFKRLSPLADFFVVNISSPNTPGLRTLQDAETVSSLVVLGRQETVKPILVKLAPDMAIDELISLSAAASEAGACGVVLTNTTTDYRLQPGARDFGGLSGAVLKRRSFEVLREVARAVESRTAIISVGGVDSTDEVYRRLRAGACLVEIYSALVFEGPGLVARIHRELAARLAADGVTNIKEVIGVDI